MTMFLIITLHVYTKIKNCIKFLSHTLRQFSIYTYKESMYKPTYKDSGARTKTRTSRTE